MQTIYRALALLFAATFLVQPAHAAIIETMPGGPGDFREKGTELVESLQLAVDSGLEAERTARAVEAFEAFEDAGFTVDAQMSEAIEAMKDPVKRQALGSLLQLSEDDPTLRELKEIHARMEATVVAEATALETGGVHQGPVRMLDITMGKLNFSQPETIEAQWMALPEAERVATVLMLLEVSEQWSATSDHPMARQYGIIADELRKVSPVDVANGRVDLPEAEAAMAEVLREFEAMSMRELGPEVFAVDPANRTVDEETMTQLLQRFQAELFEELEPELQAPTVEAAPLSIAAAGAPGRVMYDPGQSFFGDAGTGQDSDPLFLFELSPAPDHDQGKTFTGTLGEQDMADGYFLTLPGAPGIWSFYLSTPTGAPSVAMSVRLTDADGNVLPDLGAPWVMWGDAQTTNAAAGQGGGAWTRVTLQIPAEAAGGRARIVPQLPLAWLGMPEVRYEITVERMDHDESGKLGGALIDGKSEIWFQDPAGATKPNPVIFTHGLWSSKDMWTAPSTAETFVDGIKGAPLQTALEVIAVIAYIQLILVFMDLLRIAALVPGFWMTAIIVFLIVWHTIDMLFVVSHWATFLGSINRTHATRAGGGPSMFDAVKGAGYFTATWEYNQKAWGGHDLASQGTIADAGQDLRHGVNVVQQAYYNHQRANGNTNLRHPDEVHVDLVGHSMGGMVSRRYADSDESVAIGALSAPLFEDDVDKVVQIASPNGGSTPGQWIRNLKVGFTLKPYTAPAVKIGPGALPDCKATTMAKDLFLHFVKNQVQLAGLVLAGILSLTPVGGFGYSFFAGVAVFISELIKELVKILIWKLVLCGTGEVLVRLLVEDLMPDSAAVKWLDTHHNPSVQKAIIYGVPWVTWYDDIRIFGFNIGNGDMKLLDMIVSERDALPGNYDSIAASTYNYDLHITMVSDLNVHAQTLAYLGAAPGADLKGVKDQNKAWDDRPLAHDAVLFYWNVCHKYLVTIGGLFLKLGGFKGAPPPAGSAGIMAVAPSAEEMLRTGHPASVQTRLAKIKDITPGPYEHIRFGALDLDAVIASTNADIDDDGSLTRVSEIAPDVAVLDKGAVDIAEQWLQLAGEPSTRRETDALPASIATQRILLAPPGALDGLEQDAAFRRLVDAHLARGGTVVALAPYAGDDWAAIPGGLRGYGSTEAAATSAGEVALSTFTASLAGQTNATPSMTADGFFTAWPANATILLRDVATGRPVLLEYPWGGGTVVATTVAPLVPGAERMASSDERALLRDVVNARRAGEPVLWSATNESVTVEVTIRNPGAEAATHATISLVDPWLLVDSRFTVPVDIPAGASATIPLTFTAPEVPGVWSLDARPRTADGTAIGDAYDLARFGVSEIVANPSGFAYAGAPWSIAFTAGRDALIRGESTTVTAHVANRGDADATATLEWWLPEMSARTGEPAYGGAGGGYALSQVVTVPADGTSTVEIPVVALVADDALTARLVVDGEVVAQSRFPLRAYDPTVEVALSPGATTIAPGEPMPVAATVVDVGADAVAREGTLRLVVEDASGAPVYARERPVTVSSTPQRVDATLALPGSIAPGRHVVRASVLVEGLPRGGGQSGFEVSARAVGVSWTLPAAFEAGVPATATVSVEHRGTLPIENASVTFRHLDPDGVERAMATQPLAVAPGATGALAFAFTPATDARGTHRLVAVVTTEEGARSFSVPVESRVDAELERSPGLLLARSDVQLPFVVHNRGQFVADTAFRAVAPTLGLDLAEPLRLLPGETRRVDASFLVPADVAPGAHALAVGLEGAEQVRALLVPTERLGVLMPTRAAFAAGETMAVTLANSGGVDASVNVTARLVDARGLTVAAASERDVPLLAGASASVPLAIPASAASGAYRLTVVLGPSTLEGAGTLRRSYDVEGAAVTLALAPEAATVDVGADARTGLALGATEGALEGASLRLRVVDPVPLPSVEVVADGTPVTAVATGDSLWVVERGATLSRLEGGALVPVATPQFARLDAVAALGGDVAIAGDAGIAHLVDDAWVFQPELPLVRRLAFDDEGRLWAGANSGLWRLDGSAWVRVEETAGTAVVALAAGEGAVWAGLGDLRPRLLPALDVAPRQGSASAESALVVDRQGRTHLLYADACAPTQALCGADAPGLVRVQHLLLDADGRSLAGPDTLSTVGSRTAGGIAAALLPDGRIGVAWHDARRGGLDVFYRLLDENGVPAADEVAVTALDSVQRYPALAAAPDGTVHLFWGDARHPEPANTNLYEDELYHRKLSAAGSFLTPERRLTDSKAFAWQPRAVVTEDGAVHAVYTSVEIRYRCFFFLCFPRAVFEVWHQMLAPDGTVLSGAAELSTDENGFSWFPDLALAPDGAVEVVYQDDRDGSTAIYHRRLDADTGAALTFETALPEAAAGANRPRVATAADEVHLVWARPGGVSLAPLGPDGLGEVLTANDTGAYLPRIAPLARDGLALAWEKDGGGYRGLRFARTTTEPVGRGLVSVETSTLEATRHDDSLLATSLAPTPTGALAATTRGLLAVDRASSAASTHPVDDALLVAGSSSLGAYVARGGAAGTLDDGLARAVARVAGAPLDAAIHGDVLHVATSGGLALVRADTRRVLAETTVPAASASALDEVPGPMGRQILEADVVNAQGQTLATARSARHAVEGDVLVTLTPHADAATPGEPIAVTLHVANRGVAPLRTANVSLVADGETLLARTIDIMPGDAASYALEATPSGALDLVARVRQPLAGVDLVVRDHVPAKGSVHATPVGPAAATTEPFDLSLVLVNDADRSRSVEVTLGADVRAVVLAPGASRVLEYAARTQTADTAYVFRVAGDATAEATLLVPQSAPPTLALQGPDVLAPGAGEIGLVVANPGLLPARGELLVTRGDGEPIASLALDLAPGASTTQRIPLDVAAGDNLLRASFVGSVRELTILGSSAPVFDIVLEESGQALAATVTLRGPGPISGELAWDLGFERLAAPLALAPGETRVLQFSPDLHTVDPGTYPTLVAIEENGAALATLDHELVVPEPPISVVGPTTPVAVDAGATLGYTVALANLGFTPGTMRLEAQIAGLAVTSATVRLEVGETRNVTLALPVAADAPDGSGTLVVTGAGARIEVPVTIAGARGGVAGRAEPPTTAPGEYVTVSATIAQAGAARPLEVVARHGLLEARASVPAVATHSVDFLMPIADDSGVTLTLMHPSGRVLATSTVPVAVDRAYDGNVTAILDSAEVDAGGSLRVTFHTPILRDLNVTLGASYASALRFNGSRVVTIPIPAGQATGHQMLAWSYVGGGVPVDETRAILVRGIEARALAPTLAAPESGAPLRGTLAIESATALRGVLHAHVSDAQGVVLGSSRREASVGPGPTDVAFELPVPPGAAGPVRVEYSFEAPALGGNRTLVRGDARLVLPGTWFEGAEAFAEPGRVGIRGTLVTTTDRVDLVLTGADARGELALRGAGSHGFELIVPVPENGSYSLGLTATDADGRVMRLGRTAFHDTPGIPPEQALVVEGASAPLGSVLAIAPTTTLRVVASDAGIGLAHAYVVVDGATGPRLDEAFTLPPGAHEVRFRATDRALNSADETVVQVVVDGEAPVLAVGSPHEGSLVLAGAEVLPILAVDPETGAFEVGVGVDGERRTLSGASPDTDGDGLPDAVEALLGTDPANATSVPSLPAAPLPSEVAALFADADGDGASALSETAWGTSDAESGARPWQPAPGAPPGPPRAILVASGDLRVRFNATDDVFPMSALSVRLDGVERLSGVDALDAVLPLAGEAVGEHVLTLAATDALGNERRASFVLLVLPVHPDGLEASLAEEPRAPSWPAAFAHFVEEDLARLAAEAELALEAQLLRVAGAAVGAVDDTLARSPPAVVGAPAEAADQAGDLQRDLESCPCLYPPGTTPPPERTPEL